MATRTSTKSGNWSDPTVWDGAVPANGDLVIIANAHSVRFDVSQSGFANGLGLLTVQAGGILHVKASVDTYLKMNANIDVNGAFYVAERATVSDFSLVEGRFNVYQASRGVLTYSVEETLGVSYISAWEELMEYHINITNQGLRSANQNEMMPNELIAFIETTRASLTLSDYLDYLEENAGSFYHDLVNNLLYIHTSDSSNPSGKTITGIEPINRHTVGNENRSIIYFNGSSYAITNSGGGIPVIRMFGWHLEREWSKIIANADSGTTSLQLEHDLSMQQTSKLLIGCGTITDYFAINNQFTAEATPYTVNNYDNKVITLTTGLQGNRIIGDYVAVFNRPIKIMRSTGTTALCATVNNIQCTGVQFDTRFLNIAPGANMLDTLIIKHCSSKLQIATGYKNVIVNDCVGTYFVYTVTNARVQRCISINSSAGIIGPGLGSNNRICDSIVQTSLFPTQSGAISMNCEFNNIATIMTNYPATFINCTFNKSEDYSNISSMVEQVQFIDCKFTNIPVVGKNVSGKFINCEFESETPFSIYKWKYAVYHKIISEDHQKIIGNLFEIMAGGTIETQFIDTVIQPGKLIFKPESEDYPVFKDYIFNAPANRTVKFNAKLTKDTEDILSKLMIIDPANDPLIDSSATSLIESIAEDVTTEQQIGIAYKSSSAKQLILRVYCKSDAGNVLIDVSRIEQMMQRPVIVNVS